MNIYEIFAEKFIRQDKIKNESFCDIVYHVFLVKRVDSLRGIRI